MNILFEILRRYICRTGQAVYKDAYSYMVSKNLLYAESADGVTEYIVTNNIVLMRKEVCNG